MYDCWKPICPEGAHHRRAGERLGQEDHVGVGAVDVADHLLPEHHRLGVRVVDPEDPHPVRHPEPQHPQRLADDARRSPRRRRSGRCPGTSSAGSRRRRSCRRRGARTTPGARPPTGGPASTAARSPARPPAAARRPAPRRRRSRPGCPGPGGSRRGRPPGSRSPTASRRRAGPAVRLLFAALAEGRADRVDRRQVDHVEAHRGDRGQPLGRGAEGARARRPAGAHLGALRAREQLVPGPEQRPLPLDVQRHRPGAS